MTARLLRAVLAVSLLSAAVVAALAAFGPTRASEIQAGRFDAGNGVTYTTAWVTRQVRWYDPVLRLVGVDTMPSSAELEAARRAVEQRTR